MTPYDRFRSHVRICTQCRKTPLGGVLCPIGAHLETKAALLFYAEVCKKAEAQIGDTRATHGE